MKESLRRLRPELNSMYEYFRSVNHEPDADDITGIFCDAVLPLYEKNVSIGDDVLRSIFSEVLNLAGRAFIGRHGRFNMLESELMRVIHYYDDLLACHKGFITSVFNAIHNIYVNDASGVRRWSEAMLKVRNTVDADSFKRMGLVNAWRCGLARFREEALSVAGLFEDKLLNEVFGTDRLSGRDMLSFMKQDPWFDHVHKDNSPVFLYTNGHRAVGGDFTGVPKVYSSGGVLYAGDGQSVFRIYADCFGIESVHEPESVPGKNENDPSEDVKYSDGKIRMGNTEFMLPDVCSGDVKSLAAAGNTVAWTMMNSYKIYIAGLKVADV